MTETAGVRTVVAGGLPLNGPMQAVGMNRGASLAPLDSLNGNINFAQSFNDNAAALLPNRSEDILVRSAGVNLRDQLRPNASTPVQFLYLAADCRIFYTIDSFYNFTVLWHDAAAAIWTDPGICVPGSTGYSSTPNPPPPPPPFVPNPATAGQSPAAALAGAQLIPVDQNYQAQGGLTDGTSPGSGVARPSTKQCTTLHPNDCPGGKACQPQRVIDRGRGIYAGVCPGARGTTTRRGAKAPCDNCAVPPKRRL